MLDSRIDPLNENPLEGFLVLKCILQLIKFALNFVLSKKVAPFQVKKVVEVAHLHSAALHVTQRLSVE